MVGHKGYGATGGSGRLPNATFTLDLPRREIAMEFGLIASEIARAAKELNSTPREAVEVMRAAGILDCTDEQIESVLALMPTERQG